MTTTQAIAIMQEVANLVTERSRDFDTIAAHAYNGGRASKSYVYIGDYCAYYHSSAHGKMTFERYQAAGELSKAYRVALAWLADGVTWTEVDRIHWADNSVEVTEVSSEGDKRTRTVVAPHGDIC